MFLSALKKELPRESNNSNQNIFSSLRCFSIAHKDKLWVAKIINSRSAEKVCQASENKELIYDHPICLSTITVARKFMALFFLSSNLFFAAEMLNSPAHTLTWTTRFIALLIYHQMSFNFIFRVDKARRISRTFLSTLSASYTVVECWWKASRCVTFCMFPLCYLQAKSVFALFEFSVAKPLSFIKKTLHIGLSPACLLKKLMSPSTP